MIVRSKEFTANQEMYCNLAIKEAYAEAKEYLEPYYDLRRAITADELLKRIHKDIDKKFENRIK